ncbi:isoprenyl transferase [Namhaeicola litoreus]|uniref:Isoprenyl transferase n=1 Tax=Namhaeicola litoreus TaxID=1052145 RepID=A0ABW3Y0S5_9FLAO
MELKDQILANKLPQHVAIIMDGNGRWAQNQGKKRVFGHKNGVQSVRDTVEAAAEIGIKVLTLYTFSTENWSRPKSEVSTLMSLLVSSLRKELKVLTKNNIRLHTIGNVGKLPEKARKELIETIEKTSGNTGLILNLALNYGAREELIRAAQSISKKIVNNELLPEEIDEKVIESHLYTFNLPDVDFLIRTSGELRLSNFLLWQIAYAEMYFTEVLWPDFRKDDFYKAIINFQMRERRFGKTSEQIENINEKA